MADVLDLPALGDCTTPGAVLKILGATLLQLAKLPTDAKNANAIATVANAHRATCETSDLAALLERLEGAAAQLTPADYNGHRPRPGMVP